MEFGDACFQVDQGVWHRVGEPGVEFQFLNSVIYVVWCASGWPCSVGHDASGTDSQCFLLVHLWLFSIFACPHRCSCNWGNFEVTHASESSRDCRWLLVSMMRVWKKDNDGRKLSVAGTLWSWENVSPRLFCCMSDLFFVAKCTTLKIIWWRNLRQWWIRVYARQS